MRQLRIALWSFVVSSAFAATADDWQSRTIYQVVTDRFATSDGSSPSCDTSDRKYCGGTWKGIEAKIDYIQRMGFDAIWISPVVANIEGNTAYGEAFHGYWTNDINSLNSHFGTAQDLKDLSAAMHARNMYFMVDVVVNHMAAPSNPPDYSTFQPFSLQSDFHTECFISDYSNQTDVEQCWLGDKDVPLADINTEDPTIVGKLNTWIHDLVNEYSIDGIRIDTVKHIRKDFWPDFAKSAGVFTIGEVLDGDTSYVAAYTQVLDSVLDYPTFFALVSAFQTTTGNISALADTFSTSQASYKSGEKMTGSFLENHDQPRFQSLTQDQALVKNAMAWPFVQDAIPVLYYGQEQGYAGGADPANREALWLSGYVTDNNPLLILITSLNAARKAAISTNDDFTTNSAKLLALSSSTIAISKPPMLALLTNGGNTSTPTWTVSGAGYKPGEELVDILSCTKLSADKEGGVSVTGSGGAPQVLLPRTALNATGSLCVDLAASSTQQSQSPPNGAARVVLSDIMGHTALPLLAVVLAATQY